MLGNLFRKIHEKDHQESKVKHSFLKKDGKKDKDKNKRVGYIAHT